MEKPKEKAQSKEPVSAHSMSILSSVLRDGRMVELLYDGAERSTHFAVWDGSKCEVATSVRLGDDEELVPYSAKNSLIGNHIVLFPSEATECGSKEELVKELRDYLHRYVDVSESFEKLAVYYALMTWVYDRFNEQPYLRLRGDYGTGKTRFLLTLGSICYKPIFASGASSVSPLFHMLDRFGGTLIVDEADFRFSDEKADLTKILNNGNVRGFPVLRSESKDGREFNPRAFQVFGPKIIAMRDHLDDPALESRFITETSGERPLRKDIPINLPSRQREEAERLRNKLLMYRFKNYKDTRVGAKTFDPSLEPRINQIYAPLAAVIDDEEALEDLRKSARGNSAKLRSERGASMDAQVLTVIRCLMQEPSKGTIGIKDITELFARFYAGDYDRQITNHWVGHIVRRRLNLVTQKSHGNFVMGVNERAKLEVLFERYGVTEEDATSLKGRMAGLAEVGRQPAGGLGDLGDSRTGPALG